MIPRLQFRYTPDIGFGARSDIRTALFPCTLDRPPFQAYFHTTMQPSWVRFIQSETEDSWIQGCKPIYLFCDLNLTL